MPFTIRFHLDEHGSNALAKGLRKLGIDVTTTHSVGLSGATDTEQLAYCLSQTRVIVTQDDDYLKLHAAGIPHAGISYCHQGSRGVGRMIRSLQLIWEVYEPHEMMNYIEYL